MSNRTRCHQLAGKAAPWFLFVLATLSVAVSLTTHARADDESGAINGFVYNYRGESLQNATLLIYTDDDTTDCVLEPYYSHDPFVTCGSNGGRRDYISNPTATRFTNGSGFFSFLALPPGRYMLIALGKRAAGKCTSGLVVVSNALVRVNFYLLRDSKMSGETAGPCFSRAEGSAIYF